MTSIFLTGATGYVGGQVLHELIHAGPEYAISALMHTAEAGKRILQAYPKASVVLHVASNKHIPSVQAIHRGLTKRQSSDPAFWVQVSGASLLAVDELASDKFKPGEASSAVYDDVADIGKIHDLIQAHSSREVDNYLLDVATKTPWIKTALVLPPIIYGLGQGPGNTRSIQIPSLAKTAIEKGHAVRVGEGLSRWGNVHVGDVARVFAALAEAAAKGSEDDDIWGVNGIYLTGVGEQSFADISDRIAAAAVEQGLIETTQVEALYGPEADTVLPHGSVLFGTNARSKACRATQRLNWAPREECLEVEIPRAVAEEAQQFATST